MTSRVRVHPGVTDNNGQFARERAGNPGFPVRSHRRPADTGPVIGAAFGIRLAEAQGGDEDAFACLFRDVQPVLLRYLRLTAPGAADDVASETWLQVVAGLAGFSGGESAFRAWLFTIARHRAIDWGRAQARRRHGPAGREDSAERLTVPDAAEAALERISTQAALARVSDAAARSGRDHPAAGGGGPGGYRGGPHRRQVPRRGAGRRPSRPPAAGRRCGSGRCNAMTGPGASPGEMPKTPVPGRAGPELDEQLLDAILAGQQLRPMARPSRRTSSPRCWPASPARPTPATWPPSQPCERPSLAPRRRLPRRARRARLARPSPAAGGPGCLSA